MSASAGKVSPGEVILHTDDGAGASQEEHWKPTVGAPTTPV